MRAMASHIGKVAERRAVIRFAIFGYLPLIFALVLRVASGSTVSASYAVLTVYALFGRANAILALILSWLFTMINVEFVADGDGSGVGRYLVILASTASALYHRGAVAKYKGNAAFNGTVLLVSFLLLHSILFSARPDVSILKVVSWGLTMLSLIAHWDGMSGDERRAVANRIYYVLVIILVVSLPLLNTSVGFAFNQTGFQGVMNHPQAFGLTMAILAAWASAKMFMERRPKWTTIIVAGASFFAVIWSEARTGGLAVILGLSLSLFLSPSFAGKSFVQLAPGFRSWRVWAIMFVALGAMLLMGSVFLDFIDQFISKSGRADVSGLLDAYDKSRGILIEPMLANISNDPFRGIGFGIASNPNNMVVERDPVFGFPLGAPIEKGTAPLAILEELGIVGAIAVAFWVRGLLKSGAKSGLAPFTVCIVGLALNMGEFTLFSVGGQGLLTMVLFGWVYASNNEQFRAESNQSTTRQKPISAYPLRADRTHR